METLILVVHVLVAIAMTALILLQQGKGAEMGASFGGGSSQTVFGAAGAASFLTRFTAVLAAIFFITSLSLAIYARKHAASYGVVPVIPAETATTDSKPAGDVPVAPAVAPQPAGGDVPVAPVK
ncbi:MAG: preprotein translocase subunit SecG [Moraxellaceae bacterium]|nr:preprotein translocase subunit SecG [Moraxellaceae bacterium]